MRIIPRTSWLVAAALLVLLLAITGTMWVAFRYPPGQDAGAQASLRATRATPLQIAAALPGRRFTRDVQPPELADAAALRDVFVPGSAPGLIGQVSTTTSDLGGTVTVYVFADPVWAQAFFETPPSAYGCGVCTSMADPAEVRGVGARATSFVLYRKQIGGQTWIATTTYVLSGAVVIDGLYFPVNVSSPHPTPTDLAAATAYAKAGLQLVNKI